MSAEEQEMVTEGSYRMVQLPKGSHGEKSHLGQFPVKAGVQCVSPGFPQLPLFLWEWGDREAPWDCCPGVGKVDTPTPCRKSGIFLS